MTLLTKKNCKALGQKISVHFHFASELDKKLKMNRLVI